MEQQDLRKRKRTISQLLIFSILLTPFIAVGSPICFFTALYFYDPFTPSPEWFSDTMLRFFLIDFSLFAAITLLKYPLFIIKRSRIEKGASVSLFYNIVILSQLPFLFLLKIYQEYWSAEIVSESFARTIVIALCTACWIGVFIIYNYMIAAIPSDESTL